MRPDSLSYLKKIIDTPSPSGYEQVVQAIFRDTATTLGLSTTTDRLGNVIANLHSIDKPKLLISAHIDEIGFVIKHIDESGFLYIVPVGGVDKMLLPGSRLLVNHQGAHYLGMIGRKPIHLLSEQERNRFDWEDLWVDCGFSSKKHALENVNIGDPVVFNTDYIEMTDSLVATRSADNKVGNAILIELMSRLTDISKELNYDIFFVSTVQEEIGLRGAIPAAYTIHPDISIIIDAAHATDYPAANPKTQGDIKVGEGPVIAISPDTDRNLSNALIETAYTNKLKIQRDVYPNASGTEAKAMQLQGGGISTATLSFPVRYMHSPSELFSINDAVAIADILEFFILTA